jgi:hypothetical protein
MGPGMKNGMPGASGARAGDVIAGPGISFRQWRSPDPALPRRDARYGLLGGVEKRFWSLSGVYGTAGRRDLLRGLSRITGNFLPGIRDRG